MRARHDSRRAVNSSRLTGVSGSLCRAPVALFTSALASPIAAAPSLQFGAGPGVGGVVGTLDLAERNSGGNVPHVFAVKYRQIRRHRTVEPRSAQRYFQRLERMHERVIDRRSLESAMRHAVIAGRVAADPIVVPRRILHEGLEAWRIAFIGEQIAGPLPAEDIVGR